MTLVRRRRQSPIFSSLIILFFLVLGCGFVDDYDDDVVLLKKIIRYCDVSSSLKINLSESILVGLDEMVQSLTSELHCKVGKLPFLYLGLPIGAHSRSKAVWDPIVENFK